MYLKLNKVFFHSISTVGVLENMEMASEASSKPLRQSAAVSKPIRKPAEAGSGLADDDDEEEEIDDEDVADEEIGKGKSNSVRHRFFNHQVT
jgi:hypothetical protein